METQNCPFNSTQTQSLLTHSSRRKLIHDKVALYHGRVPGIRNLPLSVVSIIVGLIGVNILVWVVVGCVLANHTTLASTAVLAYTLGLRHALDADHIAAIDLMTRRLVATGQRPVTVGTFFSLGHSTIVIITSITVAATAAAVSSKFDTFSRIGGIIGTSVSAAFLLILCLLNIWILYKLIVQLRTLLANGQNPLQQDPWVGGGILFKLCKKMFQLIDRPWKMYPLGILFGLGFDTSSEIALLGISSIQGSSGTSLWLILLFPLLFTAGMCLLDTIDGALMMTLYTTSPIARDPIAILYYSIVLTGITVVAAGFIGIVQILTLALNLKFPDGVEDGSGDGLDIWRGVQVLGDHYDVVGGAICACFVVVGGGSILFYRVWKRWLNKSRSIAGRDDLKVEGGRGGDDAGCVIYHDHDAGVVELVNSSEEDRQDTGDKKHGARVDVRDNGAGPAT